jgi:hypothetical protein
MECGEVRSTTGRRGIQKAGTEDIRTRSNCGLYHIFRLCQVVHGKWPVFSEIAGRGTRAFAEIPSIGLRRVASRVKIAACKLR